MDLKKFYRKNSLSDQIKTRIQDRFHNIEHQFLKPYASLNSTGTRFYKEKMDYRQPYTRDADRIIHSLSYARFFDKTQVFFWLKSDMHQHRLLHVQLVSRMAREIGQILGLNQELIEAIALGHDIGHVPFGHDGEEILSDLCLKNRIGHYHHNYGSVWFMQKIEMQNLTLPVLDGIICHNGETHSKRITPDLSPLSWDAFMDTIDEFPYMPHNDFFPKTMEGALVRVVDTISYISRDIMDAENLRIVKFVDIPDNVKRILGTTNREIINSLIIDLIENSIEKPYISYSSEVFNALDELYAFNRKHIYQHPDKKPPLKIMTEAMKTIWEKYFDDLENERQQSRIFTDHLYLNLKFIRQRYPAITSLKEYSYSAQPSEIIVRDYIAGMTDRYFWHIAQEINPDFNYQYKETII